MDNIVDSLSSAYQEFLAAAASVLEAREASGAQKIAATDAALENFKQHWELFRVACDQAEEFVESVKQRIGSECLVDEATGSAVGKPGQAAAPGLPPISAVRLEQMSKARLLMLDSLKMQLSSLRSKACWMPCLYIFAGLHQQRRIYVLHTFVLPGAFHISFPCKFVVHLASPSQDSSPVQHLHAFEMDVCL
ncbi:hypothetical protein NL676_038567 [Syzygium grande]|nr:hypothetical protein NL676_038567 [Syzygium grande]